MPCYKACTQKVDIMNVLSLFNGMSFGYMALQSLGKQITNYYSSEIDKYANQATQAMFPDVVQLGDVTKWKEWDIDLGSIDLLLAGFPCQAWSMAGKKKGDDDPRGALVHDLIAIWGEIKKHNPNVKFMFENVKMKKEFLDYINDLFGVEPVCINSSLVSAQNRSRYYWTNIGEILQPANKNIDFNSVIEADVDNKFFLSDLQAGKIDKGCIYENGGVSICFKKPGKSAVKSECLLARDYKGIANRQYSAAVMDKGRLRRCTPKEYMRLQTVPEHHISTLLNSGISNTQLYKMAGNGWTHDVITHIFDAL